MAGGGMSGGAEGGADGGSAGVPGWGGGINGCATTPGAPAVINRKPATATTDWLVSPRTGARLAPRAAVTADHRVVMLTARSRSLLE
jgi:hypothetical protein